MNRMHHDSWDSRSSCPPVQWVPSTSGRTWNCRGHSAMVRRFPRSRVIVRTPFGGLDSTTPFSRKSSSALSRRTSIWRRPPRAWPKRGPPQRRRRCPPAPRGAWPHAASRSHDSLTSPLGEIVHAVGAPRNYHTYATAAQASWEIDLFGSLRRGREAAMAEAQAAEVSQTAIRIAISAEAADAYLDLRGLQAQLQLAESQEATQSHLVELVRMRLGQGVSSDRELQRASENSKGYAP